MVVRLAGFASVAYLLSKTWRKKTPKWSPETTKINGASPKSLISREIKIDIMKSKLSVIFVFACSITFSQSIPKLPIGYKLATGVDEETTFVFSEDFDHDGIKDFAGVITKKDEDSSGDKEILIILSSKKNTPNYYSKFPLNNDAYFFSFEKNVLNIEASTSGNPNNEIIKLKYYPQLISMRLIGYESNSFDVQSDDMYSLSINFLTNKGIKSNPGRDKKTKKKITVSKYLTTSFPVIKLENMNRKLFSTISSL